MSAVRSIQINRPTDDFVSAKDETSTVQNPEPSPPLFLKTKSAGNDFQPLRVGSGSNPIFDIMPDKDYLLNQARMSRRLANSSTDQGLADRFNELASEYEAEACMASRAPHQKTSPGDAVANPRRPDEDNGSHPERDVSLSADGQSQSDEGHG